LTKLKYPLEARKNGWQEKNKFEAPAYALEDIIKATLPGLLDELLKRGMSCGCSEK